MNKALKSPQGFTIVEMLVVILVIGILVTLTVFGFRGWQQGLSKSQVKSDLQQAITAMESEKNFGEGYETRLPDTFKQSEDISVTYAWGDGTKYCIQGYNAKYPTEIYSVNSTLGKKAVLGSCSAAPFPPAAPSPSAVANSTTSITVSWPNVNGAASYAVRYGTGTPPSTLAGCSASPCTITSLTASTTYNISVTASNGFGPSTAGTTSVVTTSPAIPAPSAAGITYTTSRVKVGADYYQRYNVTATGGACSVGSTQWKIGVTGGATPNFAGETWQAANTRTVDVSERGIYSPVDVTIYVKARCVSGANSTEGSAAYAYNGRGGGTGGSI